MRTSSQKNRRQFLCESFSAAAGFSVAGALGALSSRAAAGHPLSRQGDQLIEVRDETTGLPLLKLPEGFRYLSFGWTGDPLRDGTPTPPAHDGMAVVSENNGLLTLVRNHELSLSRRTIPVEGSTYDSKAGGGCTNLTFDTNTGEFGEAWGSLSGTVRNCAGGVTPQGTWLSCEETVLGPGDMFDGRPLDIDQTHGWIFEVPAVDFREPTPLKAMGRFVHEAIACDQATGIIYETEDRGQAGFYRFRPHNPESLAEGGSLQMLKVVGQQNLSGRVENGAQFDCEWVDIEDPERAHSPGSTNDAAGVFSQGNEQGGTSFARLEGCWYGNDKIYFDATSGGAARAGQIWQYDPRSEVLTMLFESPSAEVLNMPDNLCCNPRGGLFICEDSDYGRFSQQRIHQLNEAGELSLFAVNNVQLAGEHNDISGDYRGKEWAGATFSPDGKWLFVNIQTPGITFAITGPWEEAAF